METRATPNFKSELQAGLSMYSGTTRWFRHWSRHLTYTEGVKYLAEEASAYWLIDLVASWCPHPSIRNEQFVVWTLTVRPDRTAVVIADDGNGHELTRQGIGWTDFPLDRIDLYLVDKVLLLPSEY